jgi:hypothetical protein
MTTLSDAPNYINLGYEGRNGLGAQYSNQTFQYSRVNSNIASNIPNNWLVVQCHASIAGNFSYPIMRGFMGFDTSSITNAKSAGIKITIGASGSGDNSLQASTRFVVVATTSNFLPNHAWSGNADYTSGLVNGTGQGNFMHSEIVTVNPSQTGDIFFPFNASALNSVNVFPNMSYVLMEYDHDWLNAQPVAQYATNNWIRSLSSNVKLYYRL